VHCTLAAGPIEGTARRLAVDRDHALNRAREALCPGDKAALEAVRIERAEDEAELIVARRAVGEGQEAAQERELLLAEQGDAHPAIGSAQHGAQCQQQHLAERIEHLDRLARITERREMHQKIEFPTQPLGHLINHVTPPASNHDRRPPNHSSPGAAIQISFDCPGSPCI
jgi:superfamily II RNA helicase